jgi:hypothetical protein
VHSSGRRIFLGSEQRSVAKPDGSIGALKKKRSVAEPESLLGRSLCRRSGGSWSCERAASSPECWENRCRESYRLRCYGWSLRIADRQRKG